MPPESLRLLPAVTHYPLRLHCRRFGWRFLASRGFGVGLRMKSECELLFQWSFDHLIFKNK
ncbi:hypothetical protein HanPSC8_Chr17g0774271 [Helianthus annuus]|nr:hypothetical protein HanPSC8_Chr17g0774271 [Helianthus annuus]